MTTNPPPFVPGLLPDEAQRIFENALKAAREYRADDPVRQRIIDTAHQHVRDKFPDYFQKG